MFQHLPELSIIEKMCLDRIIRPSEISQLHEMLQLVNEDKTSRGKNVCNEGFFYRIHFMFFLFSYDHFDEAIIKHNLLSVSKLYKNIKIEELGRLLGIEPMIAEKIVAQIITNGHMEGSIDQVERYIHFKSMF